MLYFDENSILHIVKLLENSMFVNAILGISTFDFIYALTGQCIYNIFIKINRHNLFELNHNMTRVN